VGARVRRRRGRLLGFQQRSVCRRRPRLPVHDRRNADRRDDRRRVLDRGLRGGRRLRPPHEDSLADQRRRRRLRLRARPRREGSDGAEDLPRIRHVSARPGLRRGVPTPGTRARGTTA
jgi:hypothetical protein